MNKPTDDVAAVSNNNDDRHNNDSDFNEGNIDSDDDSDDDADDDGLFSQSFLQNPFLAICLFQAFFTILPQSFFSICFFQNVKGIIFRLRASSLSAYTSNKWVI